MAIITAADLAWRTNQVLEALAQGESIRIKGNDAILGTIMPAQRPVTVREAFQRLQKISPDVGQRFKANIRDMGFDGEVGDPWQL